MNIMKTYFLLTVSILVVLFSSCNTTKLDLSSLDGSVWSYENKEANYGTTIKFYKDNKADFITYSFIKGERIYSTTHLISKSKMGSIYLYLADNNDAKIDRKVFPIKATIQKDIITCTFKRNKKSIFTAKKQPLE